MRFLAFLSPVLVAASSGAVERETNDATDPSANAPTSNPTNGNPTKHTKAVSEILGGRFGWVELSYRIAGGRSLGPDCEEKAFAITVDVVNQTWVRHECTASGI